MRTLCYGMLGAASFLVSRPGYGQAMSGTRPLKGEVRWVDTYLGWAPQAWFKERAPLTTTLLATLPDPSADSLTLLLPSDYHLQLPSGKHYIQVYLLNPTAREVAVGRADATVSGLQVVLRLEGQWVLPTYPGRVSCGNGFWQDTLVANSYFSIELDADNFYQGTVPVECRVLAQVGGRVVKSPVFTALLTPLQLYFLRYPRVPFPDIY